MKELLSRLIAFTPNNTITRNKEALSRLAAKVREAEQIQKARQQEELRECLLQGGEISLSATPAGAFASRVQSTTR